MILGNFFRVMMAYVFFLIVTVSSMTVATGQKEKRPGREPDAL